MRRFHENTQRNASWENLQVPQKWFADCQWPRIEPFEWKKNMESAGEAFLAKSSRCSPQERPRFKMVSSIQNKIQNTHWMTRILRIWTWGAIWTLVFNMFSFYVSKISKCSNSWGTKNAEIHEDREARSPRGSGFLEGDACISVAKSPDRKEKSKK